MSPVDPAPAVPPVEIVIGTKAQYIKTAPVMRELDRRGIPYRLIDTGQHAGLTGALRADLGVQEPTVRLAEGGNVATLLDAARWALGILALLVLRPRHVRERVFDPKSRYCVIHGDTPTTLLSLLLAKVGRKRVVHLEAGLRSKRWYRPFPEELVRIVCMRFADLLFTPSETAYRNLQAMNVRGRIVALPQNTNVEAMYYALDRCEEPLPEGRYALVTIHRVETIFSRARLEFVLDQVAMIARTRPVVFVLHDPTRKRLEALGMIDRLFGMANVQVRPLMNHSPFLRLLDGCEFVVTDGGSIQEEAFFLDKPCLVMRSETERDEGLATNVRLCDFDADAMDDFLASYTALGRGHREENRAPSALVVDQLAAAA